MTDKSVASESSAIVRSRKKLEEKVAKVTQKVDPEVIKEKKDEIQKQLGRRPDRAHVRTQFADGKEIARESERVSSVRSKLSGS